MSNPYESPKTHTDPRRHSRRLPFDIGRFVGRYLQVLAWISIASMVVNALFFVRFQFDLSFVFLFWAGACLIRHGPTARKWVIAISGLHVFACFAVLLYTLIAGTDGMTAAIGRRIIENPPVGYVAGVVSCLALLAGIPFVLLLTRQARNEFTGDAEAAEAASARSEEDGEEDAGDTGIRTGGTKSQDGWTK